MTIKQISVIGLGVIGGSLAKALTENSECEAELVGFARSEKTRQLALELGVVNRVADNLVDAVCSADVIVLAIPVTSMEALLIEIADKLKPGAIVTDVGSTKVDVDRWARQYLPSSVTFIGGHPMAGSAAAGIEGVNSELFKGTLFCVIEEAGTTKAAKEMLEQLITWLGATPITMTAQQHDQHVAGVSHLPVVLSSALVTALAGHEQWQDMSKLAAQGFREMSRIAAGSSEVRQALCRTNQQEIATWINRYIDVLSCYRDYILEDDDRLLTLFESARLARREWTAERRK